MKTTVLSAFIALTLLLVTIGGCAPAPIPIPLTFTPSSTPTITFPTTTFTPTKALIVCPAVGAQAENNYSLPTLRLDRGEKIVVTTLIDVVNGDVSSVEALFAAPGSDGISLREAILATNMTPGQHTIQFDRSLKGGRIMIGATGRGFLPRLAGGSLTINGDIDGDGESDITLDGSLATHYFNDGLLIASSDNLVYRMTLEGFAIGIALSGCKDETCSNTVIENNQVIGNKIAASLPDASGIEIKVLNNPWQGTNFEVRNTLIAENTINSIGGTGIFLFGGFGGQSNETITSTTIVGNKINGGQFGITLFAGDTASDYAEPDLQPVIYSDNNVIRDIIILDNSVTGVSSAGIIIGAGNFGNQYREPSAYRQ